MNHFVKFTSSGLGLGYLPKAPGTFGSLLGIPLFWCFTNGPQTHFIIFTLVISLFAIMISDLAEDAFGEKDCQKIVIDEVAGILVTYCFVPFNIWTLGIGFVLFRFFDIVKVFPVNWAQGTFKGGLGVVADDLFAGLQAGIILYLIWIFGLA